MSAAMTTIEQQMMDKQFGWGEPDDPGNTRLYKERLAAEDNENEGIYTGLTDLLRAKGEPSAIEKLVEEKMPYDEGWDFDFVDMLLWNAVPNVNQNPVGSCVGAGSGSAVASKSSTEILIEGDFELPFGMEIHPDGKNTNMPDCAIPFIGYHYGAGKTKQRWDGSQFNGRGSCGDGSYCSAQIWALKTTGVIACSEVKNFRKGPQSDDVRSWGCNRAGELNDHLEFGLQHLMKDTTRARSGDDLKNIICTLKQPLMICSSWAFVPSHQVEGLGWVYKRRGTWMHNMSLVACVRFKGKWYVKVRNQWGRAHRDGWYFWIELDLANTWMRSAEAQSIGELTLKPSAHKPDFPFADPTIVT